MSLHIAARDGEIADRILLPGDPLRAKYIAETFLDDAVCYTDIRNILGYTGTYKGVRLSVQGTGMGIPSISIYATELMRDYGVKKLLRQAYEQSVKQGIPARVGNIVSVDRFYDDEIDNDKLTQYGIMAVEMETAGLYTLAAKYGAQALGLFTVSDHLLTGEACTPEERQTSFDDMIRIALETAIQE